MHHEVVQQLCRPQINSLAGRPSYWLLKEVRGRSRKPFSRNHGERVPGGQLRCNTPCGRDVRRDRPGHANRRAVPVYQPHHHMARGPKRPTKPKTKPLRRRLRLLDLQTQCKQKGLNPYTTKLTPTSIGLRLSSQRYGSQESSHPCTRPRVAAKTNDRVLNEGAARLTPICLCASDTIVRYDSASGLKHG